MALNKKNSHQKSLAFTTMELLVTVAILLILFAIFLYFGPFKQIDKAHDADRKKDLERLSIAFEDYNNDHYCYPTQEMINNCDSDDLSPYLDSIPCDPTLKVPYQLIVSPDSCPQNFIIFALLQNESDPEGNEYSCYSVHSPESDTDEETNCTIYFGSGSDTPTPTPTDTPSPTPEYNTYYYCSGSDGEFGNCTEIPAGKTCSPLYGDDPWCNNECGNPSNTCVPY